MPRPAIVAVEDGVSVFNPDSATLARWALSAHLEACRTCKNEYCPTAIHLDAAARPDASWIPDLRTGA